MGTRIHCLACWFVVLLLLYKNASLFYANITLSTLQITFEHLAHVNIATSCYEYYWQLIVGLFHYYFHEYFFVEQQLLAITICTLAGAARFYGYSVAESQGNAVIKLFVRLIAVTLANNIKQQILNDVIQGEFLEILFGKEHLCFGTLQRFCVATLEHGMNPPISPRTDWHQLVDTLATYATKEYHSIVFKEPRRGFIFLFGSFLVMRLLVRKKAFKLNNWYGIDSHIPTFHRYKILLPTFILLTEVVDGAGKLHPMVLVLHVYYDGSVGALSSYDAFTPGGPCSIRGYDMCAIGVSRFQSAESLSRPPQLLAVLPTCGYFSIVTGHIFTAINELKVVSTGHVPSISDNCRSLRRVKLHPFPYPHLTKTVLSLWVPHITSFDALYGRKPPNIVTFILATLLLFFFSSSPPLHLEDKCCYSEGLPFLFGQLSIVVNMTKHHQILKA
ncbi:hypothetical protein L1987_54464 [Smallanthus sonchifolius]|uniref:Uncharacterized protein n=1 Tax=Smallanthus sonchifolius TaxID=185202 RepID=A0ACB9E895_9ASTR|nr:hypothetical protein L1987_54464 [Smallanthus sonchifolius]